MDSQNACLVGTLFEWTSNQKSGRDPHLHVAAFSLTFLLLSLLIAFAGDRMTVGALAVSGSIASFILGISLVGMHAPSMLLTESACHVAAFLIACLGLLGGILGTQLYRVRSFGFGALFGWTAMLHLLSAVPIQWDSVGTGPVVLERRVVPFWLLIFVSGGFAGGYTLYKGTQVGSLVTSCLGAWGVVFATRGLMGMYGAELEGWMGALLFCATCLSGMWTQHYTRKKTRAFVQSIRTEALRQKEAYNKSEGAASTRDTLSREPASTNAAKSEGQEDRV